MKDFIEKKGNYDPTIYVDSAALGSIFSRLKSLKFNQIKIVIPNEGNESKNKIIELQEFLNLDRVFPAVIISAENKQKNEKIKILIKNAINKKYTFSDEIFKYVSTNTNDPLSKFNLFVSTEDQIRTNGLYQFIVDFLKDYAKGSTQLYLTVVTVGALGTGLATYYKRLEPPLLYISLAVTIVVLVIGILVLPKRGLHIKNDRPDPSLPLAVQELKKGWLVLVISALVGLLMGVLGTYIAKLLNLG